MSDDARQLNEAVMNLVRLQCCTALAAVLASTLAQNLPAAAEDAAISPIPGRSIRLIIPRGSGAGADILGRLVGPKLGERWKVTTVADNRTGASGDIGIVAAAGAEPDGYTLLCVATVFTINPFM